MATLVTPSNREVKGAWILIQNDFEHLGAVIKNINAKIHEVYERKLKQKAQDEFEKILNNEHSYYSDFRANSEPKMTFEEVFDKVKSGVEFRNNKNTVILQSKDGFILRDSSIEQILQDAKLVNLKPTSVDVYISQGPIEFKLGIETSIWGSFTSKLSIEDEEAADYINHEVDRFIDEKKPNSLVTFWKNNSPFLSITLAFLAYSFY